MAIQHTTTVDAELLIVRASGFDGSLEEVEAYGLAVIEACVRSGVSRVLCDERDLEYRLGTFDTFRAAAFLSTHAPKVGRVALVPRAAGLADARFWEDVVVNRGLTVKVFPDLEAGRAWLRESPPATS